MDMAAHCPLKELAWRKPPRPASPHPRPATRQVVAVDRSHLPVELVTIADRPGASILAGRAPDVPKHWTTAVTYGQQWSVAVPTKL